MLTCQTPKFDHWPEYFDARYLYHFVVHHQRIGYEYEIIRILHLGHIDDHVHNTVGAVCVFEKHHAEKNARKKHCPLAQILSGTLFSTWHQCLKPFHTAYGQPNFLLIMIIGIAFDCDLNNETHRKCIFIELFSKTIERPLDKTHFISIAILVLIIFRLVKIFMFRTNINHFAK